MYVYVCIYICIYLYLYIYINIIFLFCSNSGGVSAILLDEFSRPYFVASRFDPFAFSNFSPPNDVDISLEISALRSRIVSRIVFNQYAIVRAKERNVRASFNASRRAAYRSISIESQIFHESVIG